MVLNSCSFSSVARDNPLYVDPAAVTDDGIDGAGGVPSETTPLDVKIQ